MATAIQHETATGETTEQDTRLEQLRTRVALIKDAKLDAVANTRALTAIVRGGENTPREVVLTAPGNIVMQIGDVAHDQFSSRQKIDRRYYDRMRTDAPELLAMNLNWWFEHTPEDRLLRMLKPTGLTLEEQATMGRLGAALRLRGVLGKGYRTIDDADLVEAIVPTLLEQGAKLVDFSIDDRRLHAKFATEFFTMEQLRELYARRYGLTPNEVRHHARVDGKDVAWVEEPMAYGIAIRHSEVGYASLGASEITRIAKCLNDMTGESVVAIRHTGGKNGKADDGDVRYLSDTTQMIENAALISRVQDTIRERMDPKYALERANAIVLAKVNDLPRPKEQPLFEFVGNLGLNLGLRETEIDLLKEETVKSIAEEGGEKRFAFIQGITAVARQMTDYDRRLDIERSGFALLNDDPMALVRLGRDAERAATRAKAAQN